MLFRHQSSFDNFFKDKIDETIQLSFSSAIQGFSFSNVLLCLALIKKHGFSINDEIIKEEFDKYEIKKPSDFIKLFYYGIKKQNLDNESSYNKYFDFVEKFDFVYNEQYQAIPYKITMNQELIKKESGKNITSEFYEWFCLDI